MPYKSAKGLERPVVIVTGVHLMPGEHSNTADKKRIDRKTIYVALTRAQKELYITAQRKDGFVKDLWEIIRNEKIEVNDSNRNYKEITGSFKQL